MDSFRPCKRGGVFSHPVSYTHLELADILRDQLGVLIHPGEECIRHIRAVLADGGQHLGRHPALELL